MGARPNVRFTCHKRVGVSIGAEAFGVGPAIGFFKFFCFALANVNGLCDYEHPLAPVSGLLKVADMSFALENTGIEAFSPQGLSGGSQRHLAGGKSEKHSRASRRRNG